MTYSNMNLPYSFGGQESKMYPQGCIPFGGSRGEFIPLSLSSLWRTPIFSACGPFLQHLLSSL